MQLLTKRKKPQRIERKPVALCKRQTYWNSGRMSPALHRARAPFRATNLLTGAGILTFTFGVYFYSIAAVKQDDFSDVPTPSLEQIQKINQQLEADKNPNSPISKTEATKTAQKLAPLGLLGSTENWVKGRDSPSNLIMGAPPIDQIGRLTDRKVAEDEKKIL
ncbi:hypothetical protein O181_041676 [Austropuccinia psidii MF-1]|uniref:Cytochrome c oxidase assembly factor 3 n=1 Tax=Austropuccinia psidii MF-1 TaxID=1389203 RepID=A0A9Q3DDG6_9BASI|nr:hypothetical protein [Austropuccinia psidii MF-1]